ncbi:MAG TPA: Archaeal ATPase [Lachnospiraceae bacterium]|nr:Archaeal ATPase [Lachnospiraceae bacterium]
MNNPFSLSFGTRPAELIERPVQASEITESFLSEYANQRTYMITGVRGSGKTVLLTELAAHFRERKDWTVIPLSPESDMIHSLAAKLSNTRQYYEVFRDAKINLTLFGFGLEIDGEPPVTDEETAILRMLKSIREKGGNVLITVDEVTNNEYVRKFAAVYQILIREEMPLFLIMTGLYENIYDLQNEKSLTFLYRAPKIRLKPLNFPAMADTYENTLGVDHKTAAEMAKLTKGYAFAFQVLGYFTYKDENRDYRKVITKYRQYLDEFVYEKLWSELSAKDRSIIICMAQTGAETVLAIRTETGMDSNEFSKYRLRLIRKGLVDGNTRGRLVFTLPLFEEFVLNQMEYM